MVWVESSYLISKEWVFEICFFGLAALAGNRVQTSSVTPSFHHGETYKRATIANVLWKSQVQG